ncbi:MAG: hypothetical protein H0U16_02415, partial [Actinobacteria bacterium]|nr:hypothetical protein [Actinomycetota bacterium]
MRWASRKSSDLSRKALVLLGLGWLVRPELLVSSALFIALAVIVGWKGRGWRQSLSQIAWAFTVPLAYQGFRMGYYGMLTSNPAIAKEGSQLWWEQGWQYLLDFLRPYGMEIPLAALVGFFYVPIVIGLFSRGRSRAALVATVVPLTGLIHATFIIAVGGDYVHARLLLPALFATLAPACVVPVNRQFAGVLVVVPLWAAVCGLFLRPGGREWSSGEPFTRAHVFDALTLGDVGYGPVGVQPRWLDGAGLYLQPTFLPDSTTKVPVPTSASVPVVAVRAIGLTGYSYGVAVDILDLHGLADPLTSHLLLETRGYPGHEKTPPAPWIAARLFDRPELPLAQQILLPDQVSLGEDNPVGIEFLEQTRWAEAALACPAMQRLQQASRDRLSWSRFISNIWESPRNTVMRWPENPRDAYHEFCGEGEPREVASLY